MSFTEAERDITAGYASITAIAGLGNPRAIPNSKVLILDAQIYIGSSSCESLLGALRFFNAQDAVFVNDVGLYLIYATVAVAHPDMVSEAFESTTRPSSDYNFIGDIQWMVPLSHSLSDNNDNGPVFPIDPRQRAFIHVSGVAMNCQKSAGTFDLDPEQYISCLRDLKSSNPVSSTKGVMPISCTIPDSPKYKKNKPTPWNKRYVSVSGFLTDVIFKANSEDVERFKVEVDNIVFLGQHVTQASNNFNKTPVKTPRSSKALFSYNLNIPGTPVAPVTMPTTPVTPSPQAANIGEGTDRPSKRKRALGVSSTLNPVVE